MGVDTVPGGEDALFNRTLVFVRRAVVALRAPIQVARYTTY